MGKKVLYTPNWRIKKTLYRFFLYSRERNHFMKGAVCAKCGSTEKLQCHHKDGINWDRIFKVIREELFDVSKFEALCKPHHKEITEGE